MRKMYTSYFFLSPLYPQFELVSIAYKLGPLLIRHPHIFFNMYSYVLRIWYFCTKQIKTPEKFLGLSNLIFIFCSYNQNFFYGPNIKLFILPDCYKIDFSFIQLSHVYIITSYPHSIYIPNQDILHFAWRAKITSNISPSAFKSAERISKSSSERHSDNLQAIVERK